jgi:Fe(3+) dicitrate transport protein
MKIYLLLSVCVCLSVVLKAQKSVNFRISVVGQQADSSLVALPKAEIFESTAGEFFYTDRNGQCEFRKMAARDYVFILLSPDYAMQQVSFNIARDTSIQIVLQPLEQDLTTVEVSGENANGYLGIVEGAALYASKKSDIIDLKQVRGNLAANNPRAIYAKVAGLSVWENDNSGIQLNISARGMNPNRTANFNSRQNGYDISADALGYPELYYAPPAQALERIELVRGAASLQYGTQFGGMLNFVLKSGNDAKKPFHFSSENTYGSFGFFNTFNSISGKTSGKRGSFSYFGFYQYKRGDGWRANSGFEAQTGYLNLQYKSSCERLTLRLEQTVMDYLAQQAGGLTDAEFSQTPRLSKRARNWFGVGWRVSALHLDYKIRPRLSLNSRLFYLNAERASLGNLQPINRPDYGDRRDYIQGQYRNWGNETRLLYRYNLGGRNAILIAGIRAYTGNTSQRQGYSNADSTGSRADFQFAPQDAILRNDFHFPSYNLAAFAEHYLQITQKWSVTPGFRVERITTNAEGYYQNLILSPSATGVDTLLNEAVAEKRGLSRNIALLGLGTSYKPRENMEIYANFSQNYRAINFNDLRVSNPNQVIDTLLRDERGFNADLGFRGKLAGGKLRWDGSLFYLSYSDRIGNLQMRRPNAENPAIIELYTLRTNIGNARVLGLEMLLETDILAFFAPARADDKPQDWATNVFVNFSYLDGRYLDTEFSFTNGKKLEFVSPLTFRTGASVKYKTFDLSAQLSYTDAHYTDATNAEFSPAATVGIVPNYTIIDLSAGYSWRFLRLQAGCNNLSNAMYFTRRALSYPGPGIIPADGRSFYLTLRLAF